MKLFLTKTNILSSLFKCFSIITVNNIKDYKQLAVCFDISLFTSLLKIEESVSSTKDNKDYLIELLFVF